MFERLYNSNTNTKSLEVYKLSHIKPTPAPPPSICKHAPSGRSYLCRRTVGKNGRMMYIKNYNQRIIPKNEQLETICSRDYRIQILIPNTNIKSLEVYTKSLVPTAHPPHSRVGSKYTNQAKIKPTQAPEPSMTPLGNEIIGH